MRALARLAGAFALVAALLAGAAALAASHDDGETEKRLPPSPIILPRPTIPLLFSHAGHMKLGMKCLQCHGEAMKSVDSADSLLPKMQICVNCHNVKAPHPEKVFPKATCDVCHPGFHKGDDDRPPVVTLAIPRLRMSHKTHALLAIKCDQCHAGVEKMTAPSAGAWGEAMPTMATCIKCHNGADAPSQCTTCHLAEDDGRIIQRFPEGKLFPTGRFHDDDHRDPSWNVRHGAPARDAAYCASCHTQESCLVCHAGAETPREIHPGNWIVLHARDALASSSSCLGCHEGGVGCQKCHEATGVTEAIAEGRTGAGKASRSIHPPGWASLVVGPDHHSVAAKTSISTCVSCHSESECIRCHADQTLRINPHPPGFKGGVLQSRNDSGCRKCHVTIPR